MKDSKLKILLPIIIIPLLLIIILIILSIHFVNQCNDVVNQYNDVVNQYNDDFVKLSEKNVKQYLSEKYDSEFENITLVGKYKTNHSGEYSCGTMWKSEFINYYLIHSQKYNTDFIVCFDKKIFGIKVCEGDFQKPEEIIKDNFEVTRAFEQMAEEELYTIDSIEEETVLHNANGQLSFYKTIVINDTFNEDYYKNMLELQARYKEYLNVNNIELINYNNGGNEINTVYFVKFNNIEFVFSSYEGKFSIGDGTVYIDDKEFWDYLGE